jgi:uncharacterized protein YecT (DUF1311 family)
MRHLFILPVFLISTTLNAQDFKEKPISEFKELDQFDSVEAFEEYIDAYRQECLDASMGYSRGIQCFVGSELWDRELNTYYRLLQDELTDEQSELLRSAQQSWIETRDRTIQFNSSLLDQTYDQIGTMYVLMRAGDASRTMGPIIKQRALLLREWYLGLSVQ